MLFGFFSWEESLQESLKLLLELYAKVISGGTAFHSFPFPYLMLCINEISG